MSIFQVLQYELQGSTSRSTLYEGPPLGKADGSLEAGHSKSSSH